MGPKSLRFCLRRPPNYLPLLRREEGGNCWLSLVATSHVSSFQSQWAAEWNPTAGLGFLCQFPDPPATSVSQLATEAMAQIHASLYVAVTQTKAAVRASLGKRIPKERLWLWLSAGNFHNFDCYQGNGNLRRSAAHESNVSRAAMLAPGVST